MNANIVDQIISHLCWNCLIQSCDNQETEAHTTKQYKMLAHMPWNQSQFECLMKTTNAYLIQFNYFYLFNLYPFAQYPYIQLVVLYTYIYIYIFRCWHDILVAAMWCTRLPIWKPKCQCKWRGVYPDSWIHRTQNQPQYKAAFVSVHSVASPKKKKRRQNTLPRNNHMLFFINTFSESG